MNKISGHITRLVTLNLLFVIFWLAASGAANAVGGDWSRNDHAEMRLVSGVTGVGYLSTIPIGLQFRMKPGWKLYWRTPGNAGFPPRADWSSSENVSKVEIEWPAPKRFSIFNLETLGYENEVIFPLNVTLTKVGEPVQLDADIDYLTCKEICIPYSATAKLSIGGGRMKVTEFAFEIEKYRARVPGDGERHGLRIKDLEVVTVGEVLELRLVASSLEPFRAPDAYLEGPEGFHFGKPVIDLSEDGMTAVLEISGGGFEKPMTASSIPITVTLVDGDRNMEERLIVKPNGLTQAASNANDGYSLLVILLFALVGGLILNLMPCVLPVLSLKLLNVVGQGGQDPTHVRHGFIASAAGIVFSFLLIAGGIIAIRSAGVAIGWGIQFQQPIFLVVMVLILTLFACNLFGLFEVLLPGRLMGIVGSVGNAHSLGGQFLTGAFATLLATPCSAPFLGTAVGFALSRGPSEILGIFFVLGIGLALPYLAVAAFPRLASQLPKPGNWMKWLRFILALALVATAIWLVTVLSVQLGIEGAASILALLALIVAVLALKRLHGSRLGQHAGKVTAVLSVAALFVGALVTPPSATINTRVAGWENFDERAITRYVSVGKTVFIDVTADWCLTCQANKKFVLDTSPLTEWLDERKVVRMVADWTRPDREISNFLERFGRYGIPFNVVYGPKAPEGITLPELLTDATVMKAVDKAGSTQEMIKK